MRVSLSHWNGTKNCLSPTNFAFKERILSPIANLVLILYRGDSLFCVFVVFIAVANDVVISIMAAKTPKSIILSFISF